MFVICRLPHIKRSAVVPRGYKPYPHSKLLFPKAIATSLVPGTSPPSHSEMRVLGKHTVEDGIDIRQLALQCKALIQLILRQA